MKLDINFMRPEDNDIPFLGYKLFGLIVHIGASVQSGHYIYYGEKSGVWYKYNDAEVTKVSVTEVLSLGEKSSLETPYIFFYERVSEPSDDSARLIPPVHEQNNLPPPLPKAPKGRPTTSIAVGRRKTEPQKRVCEPPDDGERLIPPVHEQNNLLLPLPKAPKGTPTTSIAVGLRKTEPQKRVSEPPDDGEGLIPPVHEQNNLPPPLPKAPKGKPTTPIAGSRRKTEPQKRVSEPSDDSARLIPPVHEQNNLPPPLPKAPKGRPTTSIAVGRRKTEPQKRVSEPPDDGERLIPPVHEQNNPPPPLPKAPKGKPTTPIAGSRRKTAPQRRTRVSQRLTKDEKRVRMVNNLTKELRKEAELAASGSDSEGSGDSSKSDLNNTTFSAKDFADISNAIEECDKTIDIDDALESGPRTRRGQEGQKKREKPGTQIRVKKSFDNEEGSFSLKKETWNQVWDWKNSKFSNRRLWTVVLKKHMKAFKPYCILKFKSTGELYCRKEGALDIRAYMYCGTGKCKHYALHWEPVRGEELTIIVRSCGKENHKNVLVNAAPARQGDRDILKKRLEVQKSCHAVKQEDVRNLDPIVYRDNNFQDVRPDTVYHHAQSENLCKYDEAKDDFFDIVCRRRREIESDSSVRYIQLVAEPLIVYLFAEVTIRAILDFFMNRLKITVHADATGGLVRTTVYNNKTIYLYSFIVNINGILLPLMQMISCEHDQHAIGGILGKFRTVVANEMHRKWPCISRVVTDCSFAFIHAVMREWNGTTLERYLTACYMYARGKFTVTDFNEVVLVRLCKNHWIKVVCNNLEGHLYDGGRKTVIVEAIVKLMQCKKLSDFDTVFTNFAVILLCPVKHRIVDTAFIQLNMSPSSLPQFDEPKFSEILGVKDENKFQSLDSYDTTPFHLHCKSLYEKAEETVRKTVGDEAYDNPDDFMDDGDNDTDQINEFHCPQYFNNIFFKNKYGVLVPLWTGIMDGTRDRKGQDFVASNADVEGYFKQKKKLVHADSMRDKPGRFVTKDKRETLTNTKKVLLGIRTDGKRFTEPTDYNSDSSTEAGTKDKIEETTVGREMDITSAAIEGGGKRAEKYTYSQGLKIAKIAQEVTSLGRNLECDAKTLDLIPLTPQSTTITQEVASFVRKPESVAKTLDVRPSTPAQQPATSGHEKKTSTPLKPTAPGVDFEISGFTSIPKPRKRKIFDSSDPTPKSIRSNSAKRGRLSLKGTKDTWCRRNKSESPCLSTHIGRNLQQILKGAPEEQEQIKEVEFDSNPHVFEPPALMIQDEHDDTCIITKVSELPLKEQLQQSHFLAFRPDLSHRSAPLYGLLSSSDQDFIELKTDGDLSALLFVYGQEDNPIYLKEFTQLLSDCNISAPIMDACTFSLKQHFSSNKTVHIATSAQGKEILQKPRTITLPSSLKITESIASIVIPIYDNGDWMLIDADPQESEISVWLPKQRKDTTKLLNTIREYFNKHLGPTPWSVIDGFEVPLEAAKEEQSGLLVLKFVELLLSNGKVGEYGDFRQFLASLCLKKSSTRFSNQVVQVTQFGECYSNHLIRDPRYYWHKRSHNFIVAKFGNGLDAVGSETFQILQDPYANLVTSIIDAAIHVHARRNPKYVNVRVPTAQVLLFGDFKRDFLLNHIALKEKTIVMPYLDGENHWRLIIADFSNFTFQNLDPLHPTEDTKYLDKFNAYLLSRNGLGMEQIETDRWTSLAPFPDCPVQQDVVNCGLYVIYYAHVVMGARQADHQFTPNLFRKALADFLLSNAVDMTHLCAQCGHDQYDTNRRNFGTMITCDACLRWLHVKCCKNLKKVKKAVYMAEDFKFVCHICQPVVRNK